MVTVRSSRRVAGLKPSDYDHEIGLIDDDGTVDGSGGSPASAANTQPGPATSRLVSSAEEPDQDQGRPAPSSQDSRQHARAVHDRCTAPRHAIVSQQQVADAASQNFLPEPAMQPQIEIRAATPDGLTHAAQRTVPKRPKELRETAIDVLYENERGCLLCGAAIFSSKALGGLDPSAWTNAFHRPSPTDIHTAVVPDPSWEWVWPEWRVNYQDGVDDGGWEYSFAFARAFSWHTAKWWNSFVRRRAWTRKRAKRQNMRPDSTGNLLNSDYFIIRPASHTSKRRSMDSVASSRGPSKVSLARTSGKEAEQEEEEEEEEEEALEIEDIETLLSVLRTSRIDREKTEAVDNYLEHAIDLSALQDEMHEIMSILVFQASRRQLLAHLMHQHDQVVRRLEQDDEHNDKELLQRKEALDAAVKHADEEVSRLAYWSDIKEMAESGDLRLSHDEERNWHDTRPGLDGSGPKAPNRGELPGLS